MAYQIPRPPLGSPFDKNVTQAWLDANVTAAPVAFNAGAGHRDHTDDLNAAIVAVGLDFRGVYAAGTTYVVGEYAQFERGLYRKATAAVAGTTPVAGGSADWTEVVPPSAAPLHAHTSDQVTFAVATRTAAYAALATDGLLLADATTAAFTITLPTAASSTGRTIVVKKIDSSVNVVTVAGNGAETIEGAGTTALSAQWASVRLVSTGTGWVKA